MKKVYLVFHWVNYSDWDDFDQYDYIEIEKAFQTRHEAEEYINGRKNYSIESMKIESKKKKVFDKIKEM